MMMPSIFRDNSFDNFFDFPFGDFEKHMSKLPMNNLMKTDIKEREDGYELSMELPGYKKEDVKAQLKDGYLTISAEQNSEDEEKDEQGKYIRRERYVGSVSRRFYVGRYVTESDIHAKFKDGILWLEIPKSEPKEEEKKFISIEG